MTHPFLISLALCIAVCGVVAAQSKDNALYYGQQEWGTDKFLIQRLADNSLELIFSESGSYRFDEDWSAIDGWESLEAEFSEIPQGVNIIPILSDQYGRTWNGTPAAVGNNSWKVSDFHLSGNSYGLTWADATPSKLLIVGWLIQAPAKGRAVLSGSRLLCVADGQTAIRELFTPASAEFPILWPKQGASRSEPIDTATPRVFGAENSILLSHPEWTQSWKEWASVEFPGQFGLDFNTTLTNSLKSTVGDLRAANILPVYECHSLTQYRQSWMLNNGYTLRNWNDFSPSDPIWPLEMLPLRDAIIYHGEDTTQEAILGMTKERMNLAFDLGFEYYFMIDYIWPYFNGRWGYGSSETRQWKKYLTNDEAGIELLSPTQTIHFHEYWDRFVSLPLVPSSFGWNSWEDFVPGTEQEAQSSALGANRLLLLNALWHYHYLVFIDRLGRAAKDRGRGLGITVNPEDVSNGVDVSLLSRLKHLSVLGYEFFGSPLKGEARKVTLPHVRSRAGGPQIHLIGEINGGGQGSTSRYDMPTSFAFYYDATASCLPQSINIQYFKVGPWIKGISDTNILGRFDHWFSGNHAFLLRHAEEKDIPIERPKITVVANRSILEYQDSSVETLSQDGNIASYLASHNISFEQVGRDVWNPSLDDHTQILFWSTSVSTPSELARVKDWIHSGSNRVLVVHGGSGWRIDSPSESPLVDAVVWQSNRSYRESVKRIKPVVSDELIELESRNGTIKVKLEGSELKTSLWNVKQQGLRVILKDDDGIPLLSEWPVSRNRIILIHPDLPSREESIISMNIISKVLDQIPIKSFASPLSDWSLNQNRVNGGYSLVAWNKTTVMEQEKDNRYLRTALEKPSTMVLLVQPSKTYLLANIFENTRLTVESDSNGRLSLPLNHSTEMFYYGDPKNESFMKSLSAAETAYEYCRKRTRLDAPSSVAPASLEATY